MIDGHSIIKNMSWKFAERITAQLVTFVVSIVLARLLDPSHYGVVSLVMIFITIANVFVNDGLGNALIQKKEVDELDFSSALYFNIVFSILIYAVLFWVAPFFSSFFGNEYEILTPILRVLGLRIIIAAINSIQQAYVSRHMIFKMFFWATLFGTVASALVGIGMAYNGFGAWALVGQYLTNTTVDTIVLAIVMKKRPILHFSFQRVKELFDFGIKLLGSGLLIATYVEMRSFVIGKIYSVSDLAFYDKAKQFPSLFVNNLVVTISAVLFPKVASQQNDSAAVKTTTKRSIRFAMYLMCPLMFGLIAIGETLVSVLLTDKWLPCVPLLRILCIGTLWDPIHSANIAAIKGIGRSDIIFKLELIKKTIETIVIISIMFISVEAIVIAMAVNSTVFVLLNAYPNKRFLDYSVFEQIRDMKDPLIIGIVMAAIVWTMHFIPINKVILLVLQVFVGMTIYLFLSKLTNNAEFCYIVQFLKSSSGKLISAK